METDKPPDRDRSRRLSGLALLPVICLPGLFLLLSLKYLNGSGWFDKNGDEWSVIFIVINALVSLGVALGVVRPFMVGAKRLVVTFIFGAVLCFVSYWATVIAMVMIFGLVCSS